MWLYGIDSKQLIEIARHDRGYCDGMFAGMKYFETQDEESSGIVDASSVLGHGWFLLVVQSHKLIAGSDPDLVEGGQLLAMYVPLTIGMKSA